MTKLIVIACVCVGSEASVCVGCECVCSGGTAGLSLESVYSSLRSELHRAHAYVKRRDEISLILQFTAG